MRLVLLLEVSPSGLRPTLTHQSHGARRGLPSVALRAEEQCCCAADLLATVFVIIGTTVRHSNRETSRLSNRHQLARGARF